MSRKFVSVAMLIALSLLLISCGEPTANNAANRPANVANNASANTGASSASAEADIKKTMADLAAALAKNDADAASKFYSDDYHLITAEGVDQDRTARIADMRSGATKFNSFSYENIRVRTYGDTAVAISTVKLSGSVSGRPQPSGDLIATLVFRRMSDGWKVVSGHATRVTTAATSGSAANTANTTTNSQANSATNGPASNR
jgi:ketosteroid isomerase-like protein